jgi:hypothetical protein
MSDILASKCVSSFLGAFANLRKTIISFMSVRPSVRQSERNNSAPPGWIFIKLDISAFFRKSVEKTQVALKSDKNNGYFTRRNLHVLAYLTQFFLEWRKCQKRNRETRSTHFMIHNYFAKLCRLGANVEKCCTAGQASDDNMTHCIALHAEYLRLQTHSEYETLIAFPLWK